MSIIKKFLLILVIIFFLPSILIADELDDELPKDIPMQIKEKVRQVISLGVENHGLVKMTQTMLQNMFSEQQILEAYEILIEAKMSNLSEDPIIDKLYEGVGKHVQSENIIMAMARVQERYKTANNIAQHMTSDRGQLGILTRHIAECMTAGITSKDMARLNEMLNTRSRDQSNREITELAEQALKTVKTMARMGVESEHAVEVIHQALRNGYDPNKMLRIEKAFIIQARTRSNPSKLAELFSQQIQAGVSVDDLSRPGFFDSSTTMRSYDSGKASGGSVGYNINSGVSNGSTGQGNSNSSSGSMSSGGSGSSGHSGGTGSGRR